MRSASEAQVEAAEALAGFPPVGVRARVVIHYGGLGRLLCALGFHHLVIVAAYRDDDASGRDEYHCVRCGKLAAVLCTEYGKDDGPDEEDAPDPAPAESASGTLA